MSIHIATASDLEDVASLFNDYRIFYQQVDNLQACRDFIRDNLHQHKSKIFLLRDATASALAFCQIYPATCSVAMRPYYYLSDLYVRPEARKAGHARELMSFVADHVKAEGAQRLSLETAHTNLIAQHLYTRLGYQREREFVTFHRLLNG